MSLRESRRGILLLAVLVGCGGGGGGDPGALPPTNLAPLTVSGKRILEATTGAPVRLRGVAMGVNAWAGNAADPYADRPSETLLVEADLARVRSWGGNAVTIYLDWYWFQTDAGWRWMDQVLGWCRANDVYAIPSMVVYPGAWQRGGAIYWSTRASQLELARFWTEFAARYQGRPEIAGLDVLNEPQGNGYDIDQLVAHQAELVDAVRSADTSRLVFIEPYYGDPGYLRRIDRAGLVYTPHYYHPFYFTGSGMPWIASDNIPRNVAYPGVMVTSVDPIAAPPPPSAQVSAASSGGAWQTLTLTATVPAGANIAFPALFSSQNPQGTLWFDELEYSIDGASWQPVLDGSFETPAVYALLDTVTGTYRADADHWKEVACLNGVCPISPDFPPELNVVGRVTGSASDGTASARIGPCPGWCTYTTRDWIGDATGIPVTPGATIRLRGQVKWESITNLEGGLTLEFAHATRETWNAQRLAGSLQALIGDFSDANDVPIYLGEFTPSLLTSQASVAAYVDDLLAWMDGKGFSWAYYLYRDTFPPELRCMGIYDCPADLVSGEQCSEATYVIDALRRHM